MYPLEVYIIAGKVNDLPAGVYRYIPQGQRLTKIADGDKRSDLAATTKQSWNAQVPAIIIITANYNKMTSRVGERGRRWADFEAGLAAENLHLQAVALGLGSGTVGGFADEDVKKLLNLSENETPVIVIPVGTPASSDAAKP
jgi:SagB-type dehydrogenase family enzyme